MQSLMFSTEKIISAVRRRHQFFQVWPGAVRLVDAEGDGIPGLIIDDFAGNWLVQTSSHARRPKLDPCLGFHSLYWKQLSVGQKNAPEHVAGQMVGRPFPIEEFGLRALIDFNAGYSPGFFLDQRENRRRIRKIASGKTVLNTFAYTCAFGAAAALGGAKTTNIDLSKRYLAWGKQNYGLNGLPLEAHEFLAGDVVQWLQRFRKQRRRFSLIILDPPTFSRDRRGNVFRVEKDYGGLVRQALHCLEEGGALLCCANTHRLSVKAFSGLLRRACPTAAGFKTFPMPPDFTGQQYLKSVWIEV